MTTFGPFEAYSPCSGPIDEVYASAINAYEKEIQKLQNQIIYMNDQIVKYEKAGKDLDQRTASLQNSNIRLKEELGNTERFNHQLDRQIKAIQKYKSMLTNKETQTNNNELLLARKDNADLKNQIQELITVTNNSINKQNTILQKINHKKEKMTSLKNEVQTATSDLEKSVNRENDFIKKIVKIKNKKKNYKADNMRLNLRLTETEGNLDESDLLNERLRNKYEQLQDKQKQINTQEILNRQREIYEQYNRLKYTTT
ncbi:hypothetical protein TRFO_29117 [Tritrichomonas foetus]|uniref:Uncharacterized protein n=1 Tax=Tritrichomonas foetus TaxID=1144522 RepID=A0A1J4K179_9EUKA|nr:hypothetical protein TRFO_29117 [Tritrichomonas foetus]|eukprot:OHT03510.1 hypothetical protein TRFO_29117 [Tritrichomonas foetus]